MSQAIPACVTVKLQKESEVIGLGVCLFGVIEGLGIHLHAALCAIQFIESDRLPHYGGIGTIPNDPEYPKPWKLGY